MTPGKALRQWRKTRELSQTDAAHQLDPPTTQATWTAWETGRKPPSLENAFAIERLTGGLVRAAEWIRPRKKRDPKDDPKAEPHAAE